MIYKPTQLIIEAATYDLAIMFDRMPPEEKAKVTPEARADCMARHLLTNIANQASPDVVFKLLASLRGPANTEQINAQVDAIYLTSQGGSSGGALQ